MFCDPKLCACENCLNIPGAPDVPTNVQPKAPKSKAAEKAAEKAATE